MQRTPRCGIWLLTASSTPNIRTSRTDGASTRATIIHTGLTKANAAHAAHAHRAQRNVSSSYRCCRLSLFLSRASVRMWFSIVDSLENITHSSDTHGRGFAHRHGRGFAVDAHCGFVVCLMVYFPRR